MLSRIIPLRVALFPLTLASVLNLRSPEGGFFQKTVITSVKDDGRILKFYANSKIFKLSMHRILICKTIPFRSHFFTTHMRLN